MALDPTLDQHEVGALAAIIAQAIKDNPSYDHLAQACFAAEAVIKAGYGSQPDTSAPENPYAELGDPPSVEDFITCIGALWAEVPIRNEQATIAVLRRLGVYETWEWALDAAMLP